MVKNTLLLCLAATLLMGHNFTNCAEEVDLDTAVYASLEAGNEETARQLMQQHIVASDGILRATQEPLIHLAAQCNLHDTIVFLANNNANINANEHKLTALDTALELTKHKAAITLLSLGVNKPRNIIDFFECAPCFDLIDPAQQRDYLQVLDLLLIDDNAAQQIRKYGNAFFGELCNTEFLTASNKQVINKFLSYGVIPQSIVDYVKMIREERAIIRQTMAEYLPFALQRLLLRDFLNYEE